MKIFIIRFSGIVVGLLGAEVTAAVCLGVPVVLSTLSALGLMGLADTVYLFPLFGASVAVTLYFLWCLVAEHGSIAPFRLGFAGGLLGCAGLWWSIAGLHSGPWLVYAGFEVLAAGCLWAVINDWRLAARAGASLERQETGKTRWAAHRTLSRDRRFRASNDQRTGTPRTSGSAQG